MPRLYRILTLKQAGFAIPEIAAILAREPSNEEMTILWKRK
jgi:DNA-binding transcriptional MerR regulator